MSSSGFGVRGTASDLKRIHYFERECSGDAELSEDDTCQVLSLNLDTAGV